MNVRDRLALLGATCASRHRIVMNRDVVTAADLFLAAHFGIDNPSSSGELLSRLERAAASSREAKKVLKAVEARNLEYAGDPQRSHHDVDRLFYDAIAVAPFLGMVHSLKRVFILDAAVCLSWVCKALEIRGPVLDLGCHAGYHALWLASTTGLPVTGLDLSRRAVSGAAEVARKLNAPATFVARNWREWTPDQTFEMIYSIDGPDWFDSYDPHVAELIRTRLSEGGVFLLVEDQVDLPEIVGIAGQYGLSCGMSDVVGGWTGEEFLGKAVLVFVKTGDIVTPPPSVWDTGSAWDLGGFASYANAAPVPKREKTQAYFRSLTS